MTRGDAVAVGAALLVPLAGVGVGDRPDLWLLAAMVLVGAAAWIAHTDLASYTIPDGAVVAIGIVGGTMRLLAQVSPETSGAVQAYAIATDAALCGGTLLLLRELYYRLRGIDGIGLGDVKLAAACGILLGTIDFATGLLIGSLAGLVLIAGMRLRALAIAPDRLPFGAILAPVCVVLWFAGVTRSDETALAIEALLR